MSDSELKASADGAWGDPKTITLTISPNYDARLELVPVTAHLTDDELEALGYSREWYTRLKEKFGPVGIDDACPLFCTSSDCDVLVLRQSSAPSRPMIEMLGMSELIKRSGGDVNLLAAASRVSELRAERQRLDELVVKSVDLGDLVIPDSEASLGNVLKYALETSEDRLRDLRMDSLITSDEYEAILRHMRHGVDVLARKPSLSESIGWIAGLGDLRSLMRGCSKDDVLDYYDHLGITDEHALSIADEVNERMGEVEGRSIWGDVLHEVVEGDWLPRARAKAREELAPLCVMSRSDVLAALRCLYGELDRHRFDTPGGTRAQEDMACELVSDYVSLFSRDDSDDPNPEPEWGNLAKSFVDKLSTCYPLLSRHAAGAFALLSSERPIVVHGDVGHGSEDFMLTEASVLIEGARRPIWCRVDSLSEPFVLDADLNWDDSALSKGELVDAWHDHHLYVPARDLSGIGYVDIDPASGEYVTTAGGSYKTIGEAFRALREHSWDQRALTDRADSPNREYNPPLSSTLAEVSSTRGDSSPSKESLPMRDGEMR